MERSTQRILTTHTGSLPRPQDLIPLLTAKEQGQTYNASALANRVRTATAEVVRKQVTCGVDVVNDGETGKIGYSTYVTERLTGFDGAASPLAIADLIDFPTYAERLFRGTAIETMSRPACTGPVNLPDLTVGVSSVSG